MYKAHRVRARSPSRCCSATSSSSLRAAARSPAARARPARAGCRLDGVRRRARVRRDDGGDRADAVRAARARGVRLRPAHLRVRLPRRHLPRLHDVRSEGRLGGAEPLHGRARDPRNRRVRLSLALRQRARSAAQVPRHGGEPARRGRHRDLDGAGRQAARLHARGSSSSSTSARSLSRASCTRSSSRCERQVFSVRAGEIGNQFHPFSITSSPGEPRLRITVKAVGDYTRALRRLEPGADAVVEGPYGSFSHGPCRAGGRSGWREGSA